MNLFDEVDMECTYVMEQIVERIKRKVTKDHKKKVAKERNYDVSEDSNWEEKYEDMKPENFDFTSEQRSECYADLEQKINDNNELHDYLKKRNKKLKL